MRINLGSARPRPSRIFRCSLFTSSVCHVEFLFLEQARASNQRCICQLPKFTIIMRKPRSRTRCGLDASSVSVDNHTGWSPFAKPEASTSPLAIQSGGGEIVFQPAAYQVIKLSTSVLPWHVMPDRQRRVPDAVFLCEPSLGTLPVRSKCKRRHYI